MRYFNPLVSRGARLHAGVFEQLGIVISIHAPCTGRDNIAVIETSFLLTISIHAPHAGCDAWVCCSMSVRV